MADAVPSEIAGDVFHRMRGEDEVLIVEPDFQIGFHPDQICEIAKGLVEFSESI